MSIQAIKTIGAGSKIPVKTVNVKNADVYDIIFSEGGNNFKFQPNEGKLSAPEGQLSTNNFTIVENGSLKFTPNSTTYFGILEKGVQRLTKAEVDAYQATQAAKMLNSAADAAVKSEEVKKSNITRTAWAVTGVVLLISAISAGFYYFSKSKKSV